MEHALAVCRGWFILLSFPGLLLLSSGTPGAPQKHLGCFFVRGSCSTGEQAGVSWNAYLILLIADFISLYLLLHSGIPLSYISCHGGGRGRGIRQVNLTRPTFPHTFHAQHLNPGVAQTQRDHFSGGKPG